MPLTRRQVIQSAAAAVAFHNGSLSLIEKAINKYEPAISAEDEDFWSAVRQAFVLDPNLVNFNNGGCCPSPRAVNDALKRQIDFSNQAPSYFMWRHLEPEIEHVRERLARVFACSPEEVAITRNASESLENCLFGYELHAGDEVLTTTQDYPRMINTLKQRELRDKIKMVQINTPAVPKTQKELADAFRQAITPRTKMILVSQVVFMNGQIYPVHDVVKLGREHGIPVIVDGAHAFAQFPFSNKDLDCDFYGCSLHKWLMAPIGTGMLYVRKERIPEIWSLMAGSPEQSKNIRKFEEIGTHPAANHNAIGEALSFHEMIGAERKAARLRYLRSRWTDKLRDEKKVVFHTNLAPEHSCGLTTVEVEGIDPGKLAEWLMAKHGIFVTTMVHPDYKGMRITPNVYTSLEEVDRFAEAMLIAVRNGIG